MDNSFGHDNNAIELQPAYLFLCPFHVSLSYNLPSNQRHHSFWSTLFLGLQLGAFALRGLKTLTHHLQFSLQPLILLIEFQEIRPPFLNLLGIPANDG